MPYTYKNVDKSKIRNPYADEFSSMPSKCSKGEKLVSDYQTFINDTFSPINQYNKRTDAYLKS